MNNVKNIRIGELVEYLPGGALKREDVMASGLYPVMNGGCDYSGYYSNYNYDSNVLTISHWGSSAGHVHAHSGKFWANNACWVFRPKDTACCLVKYLYYALKNKEVEIQNTCAFGGATPNLSRERFECLTIPLPSLCVQKKIVQDLDVLTNMQTNLENELKVRKKQYDYYRNRLLSFDLDSSSSSARWMHLGEVGEFVRGNGLQKKDFTETGIGCIHYGQIYTKLQTFTDRVLTFIPETLANKLVKVEKGNLIIATTSENVEDVCKAVAWLGDNTIVIGGHSVVYRHTLNPKYVAYYFQTENFAEQKRKYAQGVKVIDIKVSDLEKILIPVLPLSEQERIVNILDKFETLINDISKGMPAEIEARRKQYEYYRNKILSFE